MTAKTIQHLLDGDVQAARDANERERWNKVQVLARRIAVDEASSDASREYAKRIYLIAQVRLGGVPDGVLTEPETLLYRYIADRIQESRDILDRELAYLDDLIAGRATYPGIRDAGTTRKERASASEEEVPHDERLPH